MSSGIVLTAGVRQNLLALQNTAGLESVVQNRLATGKKVNSALDNPSSYFTSQALQSRGSELNSLLDQIGQAVQTIQAANNGLTSLTSLLQSAKSIATQAQQATAPTTTYGAVNATGTVTAETIGSVTSTVNLNPVDVNLAFSTQSETLGTITGTGTSGFQQTIGTGGTLQIDYSINGGNLATANVTVNAGDTLQSVVNEINAVVGTGGTTATSANGGAAIATASISSGKLLLTGGTNITIGVNTASTAAVKTELGVTADGGTKTSLTSTVTSSGNTFTGGHLVGTGLGGNLNLTWSKNGGASTATTTITVADSDSIDNVVAKINAALDVNGTAAGTSGVIHASKSGSQIVLTALNANDNVSIANTSTAATLTAVGLDSTSGTGQSTNLLDNIVTAGGTAGSSTLTLNVNGTAQTATFGTGLNQISDLAQLNTWLSANEGASTSAVAGSGASNLTFSIGAGASNSIGLSATDVGVTTALGLNTAVSTDNAGGLGAQGLSRTYNSNLTLGQLNPTHLSGTSYLTIDVNSDNSAGVTSATPVIVGLSSSDTVESVAQKLQANATIANNLDVSINNNGELQLTAKSSSTSFQVQGSYASAALGLTTNNTTNSAGGTSTDLLNNIISAGGHAGDVLTVTVNGGATQSLTFGTGTGQIQTLADLTSQLGQIGGLTSGLTGTSLNLQVASGTSQTSLNVGSSSTGLLTALGLTGAAQAGTQSGTATVGANSTTRANLQDNYNDLLTQIDQLANDSSYNGINLLKGDNLKITFDETGASSETIKGVTLNSNGLGLTQLNANQFQSNSQIDAVTSAITNALTTVQSTASTLGSTLSTVQIRQGFTKDLVTTLQTGADNLVVADTNLEGANLLALQTRQQLSTTALSLANQQNQAVLRLFG